VNITAALDPYRWLIGGVIVASAIGGFAFYRHSLIQEGIDREKAVVAKAVAEQKAKAEAQTRNMEEVKDEAIAQAQQRAKANAVSAANARAELDRLRKQTRSSGDLASTSKAACSQYAAAANAVLNECASALVSLAETADGHVNDLRTVTGAWPSFDRQSIDKQRLALRKESK
jgi:alanyl-tRNA synthetase